MSNNSGGGWGFQIFILLIIIFFPFVLAPIGFVFAPLDAIADAIGTGWVLFLTIILLIALVIYTHISHPAELKKQGKMECPTCKEIISLNAAICPHCGEPIKKENK